MPAPAPSPHKLETVLEDDNDEDSEDLSQMMAPSGEPSKSGLPVHNRQDWFDVPINLPQCLPEELIGLTFLCNVGDGEHA